MVRMCCATIVRLLLLAAVQVTARVSPSLTLAFSPSPCGRRLVWSAVGGIRKHGPKTCGDVGRSGSPCSPALMSWPSGYVTGSTKNASCIDFAPQARRKAATLPSRTALSNQQNSALELGIELAGNKHDIEVLSEDPSVYIVKDLLSPEECRAYIDHTSSISKEGDGRSMTRSNAPEVSLDPSRLWPLPFLCFCAGVPPIIRTLENLPNGASPSLDQILSVAFPPVLIAAAVTTALAWGITRIVRQRAETSSRTSEAVALNSDSDVPFIRDLVDRASSEAVSGGHPWCAFEAPVVTRYRPGAVFARHNDASPTLGSEWSDLGGQRVVTVITYLNTCKEGGGTRFDHLGLTVQPREGSALVFFPADRRTLAADDRTRHESLPAVEEKWIVQLFGRVGPRVPPPLGIPDSFGDR